MTKNQLVMHDSAWNTRRVRAALIWKVEPVEPRPTADVRTIKVAASRPRETVSKSSGGGVRYPLAA